MTRIVADRVSNQLPDTDPEETAEWVDSIQSVIEAHGKSRARFLLSKQLELATELGVGFPGSVTTPYLNSISPGQEPPFPGDEEIERRIRALVRWNAAVMVSRANVASDGIGGHLSTFASSASLYEVGYNHFFGAKDDGGAGDQVFFQGHASPGIYARAYLEGRLGEDDLDGFRREAGGTGLSSYPHPRLTPEFWEFPTVSMGLGPINAVYQARFNRYLLHRGIADTSASRVWSFLGDGECDEPETLTALPLAAREELDNLTFVVNCNLARLDGPVRGNGKIIQELEGVFRGAGWNVIKVVWGSEWDPLLAADTEGVLLDKLEATVDGEFQKYAVESGAYIRQHLFGPDPRLAAMVTHLSDDDLVAMRRGGHDHAKLYAAYRAAVEHRGSPTVILAKTVKGWCLGPEIEGRNAAHQIKKMNPAQMGSLRERLRVPDAPLDQALPGEEVPAGVLGDDAPTYYRPPEGSVENDYLISHRRALGGSLPRRMVRAEPIGQPDAAVFDQFLGGSGDRAVSTTMGFTMLLKGLLRDNTIGPRIVPIIPDEARTFGMDSLFSSVKIYAHAGQRYDPVDGAMQLSYRESPQGQILEEGITEAGSMASFTAASTAYATWGEHMVPFYVFYSMFGFQRVGDAIWAVGDMRGRGFLLGATAGRTTLNGEGLQHEDGHSLVLASTVPNLAAYDPAFAYEVATIVRAGLARMYGEEPEDVFYYLTLYNENYPMPAMPEGPERPHGAGSTGPERPHGAGSTGPERPHGAGSTGPERPHGAGSTGPERPHGAGSTGPAGPGGSDSVKEGILRGIYCFAPAPEGNGRPAVILFSGSAQGAARKAQELLAADHDVAAELWSVTSYKALREDALDAERWNRLHPTEAPRTPYVAEALSDTDGPIVAVSDFMKMVPDQVARWVPGHFITLGTDGYGRSDTRAALRRHFETDAAHVAVAVLKGLADTGYGKAEEVADAIVRFGIDAEAVAPRLA